MSDPQDALIAEILNVTLIPFTYTIYTLITHKIEKGYLEENPRKISTTPTLLEKATHPQERNPCSLFVSPLPLLYFERRFVPKHNLYLFRV